MESTTTPWLPASFLPRWLERSVFEQDIEVALAEILTTCSLQASSVRLMVNRVVDDIPTVHVPDAWQTKSRRLLVLMALMVASGPLATLIDAMRQEIGVGNPRDPDGEADRPWLRRWQMVWLGKVGRLAHRMRSDALRTLWTQSLQDERADQHAVLIQAVFEGTGSGQIDQVIWTLPLVRSQEEAVERLSWYMALFVSRPQDFTPVSALALLYQCDFAPIEHRGELLRRVQREHDRLLLPMLELAIEQKIYGEADWWVTVELLSFAPRAKAMAYANRFAATCCGSQLSAFGKNARVSHWVAAGYDLTCLITRLQATQRAAAVARICNQLSELLFDGHEPLMSLGVSRPFLLSWIENLQALCRMQLADESRGMVLATIDWLQAVLPAEPHPS